MADEKKPGDAVQTQPLPPADERKFDDKGHLPETDVPNKNQEHVHLGQILDKGTPVLQTRQPLSLQQGADVQILRGARPTGADDPLVRRPVVEREAHLLMTGGVPDDQEQPPDEHRPENRARAQSQADGAKMFKSKSKDDNQGEEKKEFPISPEGDVFDENKVFNRANDPVGQKEHRQLAGIDDGATTGARVGNPQEMPAEHLIGDKVHDIQQDGSIILKVLSRDKSRAWAVNPDQEQGEDSPKILVSLRFPGINPNVAQRRLVINQHGCESAERVFPPDVPKLDVLLFPNVAVHIELKHADKDGRETQPYILDFYTNNAVTPKPLEASPIAFKIGPSVLTKSQRLFEGTGSTTSGKQEFPKKGDVEVKDLMPESKAAKSAPGKTEPAKTEPAKTEPAKTEPAKTEPAKTQPGKTEPGKTEPGKTEPAKSEAFAMKK